MKKLKNIMKFPTKVTKSRPQLKTRIDHVGLDIIAEQK